MQYDGDWGCVIIVRDRFDGERQWRSDDDHRQVIWWKNNPPM